MESNRFETILNFWFGNQEVLASEQHQLWWGKSPAIDKEITEKFEKDLLQAKLGYYNHWLEDARSNLALIILADQFSRHIYRNSEAAFQADLLALSWARKGIAAGHDKNLNIFERTFFYMPFEHAEDIGAQHQSVELFYDLYQQAAPVHRELFKNYHIYAEQHRDIILRFGRFPHRNIALKRDSTDEENQFLQGPDSKF